MKPALKIFGQEKIFALIVIKRSFTVSATKQFRKKVYKAKREMEEGYGRRSQDSIFLLLLLLVIGFRVIWLNVPEDVLVFDEVYCVNAARKISSFPISARPGKNPVCGYAPNGFDPNTEHPPLARLVMAVFIKVLGNSPWSFRSPSVIMGTLAVSFLYLLVRKTSGSMIAFFAAFFYSCENLTFIHSGVVTLDIYVAVFMLMAFISIKMGDPSLGIPHRPIQSKQDRRNIRLGSHTNAQPLR